MDEFEIISPDREDILLTTCIPEHFKRLVLPGANVFRADCSFGDMLFSHYAGDGFDIWKSNYLIDRDVRVIGRANVPVLEFSVMYENSFAIDWKGVTASRLACRQIELYHAPFIDNTTYFKGGKQFATVDFHFHAAILDLYSPEFPLLAQFMEKVHKGEPARLFEGREFSSPAIDTLIREMISFRFRDTLAPLYYDSFAHLLLVHLLEKISGFNPLARQFSVTDIEKSHEARRLLSIPSEDPYTIKRLCKVLQTNPYKLKTTFRYLFNVSIGKYKKSILMEHAKVLLETTTQSLDGIAMQVGYNSQQNFSVAFRNHFGVAPGHFRRKL